MPNILTQRRFLRPFRPDQITGLALWLDPSDTATVTLDGSNNVSQISDKSGHARNASQSDTGKRPGITTLNGLNALNCDGSDDAMTGSLGAAISQPVTMFVVCLNSTGTSTRVLIDGTAGRNAIWMTTLSPVYFAGSVRTGSPASTAGQIQLLSAVFNGASSQLRRNGTVISTLDPGANSWGATYVIGANNLSTASWSGQIGEVVAYSRELDAPQILRIESYLKLKWGTP